MVVQGILALALALPTGLLFGVGYGTGVRIGYEQVYPLLFPPNKDQRNVTPTVENIKRINGIYNAIGGKEASQMGIAMGLQGAMEEIDRNPDFQALEALELRLSGRTSSRLGKEVPLKETSISDFPLGSSLDKNSPNFDPDYFIFVNKQKQDQAFPPGFDFGNKEELNAPPRPVPTFKFAKPSGPSAEFLAVNKRMNVVISSFLQNKQALSKTSGANRTIILKNMSNMKSEIIKLSRRFRDPDNDIRKLALTMRQLLASSAFK